MSLGQVGLTAESFFGGLGVVGGHFVEVRKVKKRRLSVSRRAVTARVLGAIEFLRNVMGYM